MEGIKDEDEEFEFDENDDQSGLIESSDQTSDGERSE